MTIGFAPDEIALDRPTRAARLKWVVVVDGDLAPGLQVNAAACVAAASGADVEGLLGPAAEGATGVLPGLPWIGCTVLVGDGERLAALRDRARASDGVYVAEMPEVAQRTRVYAEYLEAVGAGAGGGCLALAVVGPRNRVDRLTKGLALLS
jgi:hypothetical protein